METTKRDAVRGRLLAHMPKGGVAAQIGVCEGGFSRRIPDETQPALLHLIDPWRYMAHASTPGSAGPGTPT